MDDSMVQRPCGHRFPLWFGGIGWTLPLVRENLQECWRLGKQTRDGSVACQALQIAQ